MQSIEEFESSMKIRRKVLKFDNGSWVEIYWHTSIGMWCGLASLRNEKYPGLSWTSDIVADGDRKKITGMLRMNLAKKMNPKIREVDNKMKDMPTEQDKKAMRLGLEYGMGAKKIDELLDKLKWKAILK